MGICQGGSARKWTVLASRCRARSTLGDVQRIRHVAWSATWDFVLPGGSSDENSDQMCRRSLSGGGCGDGLRERGGTNARAPSPDSHYRLGPDSLPQDGVPKGEIRGPFTLPCKAYPGTQHTYWVFVPAQYDPKVPAALMVFQDGQAFKDEKGDMRAQNVLDNLIYRREIPVMIGGVYQSRTAAGPARADPAELGRPGYESAD